MHGRLQMVEGLARLGYVARGVVYLVVGWAAVQAARGSGSPTDTRGALSKILDEPFGQVMLAVVALGMVGYALWRGAQALLDVDDHGTDAKGLAVRGGMLVSAVIHVGLAIAAVTLLAGTGSGGGGDSSTQDWTAWLLEKPFGRFLVAGVGLVVIGVAAAHVVKAYRASFMKHITPDPRVRDLLLKAGRAGLAARAVVFAIVGTFFLVAAWQSDASESGGLGAALRALRDQPYGPWLLGAVAFGLVAFAIYSILQGLYRRIDSPEAVRRLKAVT